MGTSSQSSQVYLISAHSAGWRKYPCSEKESAMEAGALRTDGSGLSGRNRNLPKALHPFSEISDDSWKSGVVGNGPFTRIGVAFLAHKPKKEWAGAHSNTSRALPSLQKHPT